MPASSDHSYSQSPITAPSAELAGDVCSDIAASPSPFHAVAHAVSLLEEAGFSPRVESEAWSGGAGRHFVVRDGSVVAWVVPDDWSPTKGMALVGAHTDSPNLRFKPQPDVPATGFRQVGVEVYGGVLLNSWLDRDLGYSGRIAIRDGQRHTVQLTRVDEPIFRVPQLAIHLDGEISSTGLLLNKQQHMVPVYGLGDANPGDMLAMIASHADVASSDILGFDLMLHDLAGPAIVGIDRDMIASARIDNQLSCFVAIRALLAAVEAGHDALIGVALFDHEEVGSRSATGAASPFLATTLERVVASVDDDSEAFARAVAASTMVSADGAHATHPNYADRHEPNHNIKIGAGPVIKHNANERYATSARTTAAFAQACERAGAPYQHFVNRTDLGCGSTIGPVTAAELGMATVDVGCAQLAMHSVRELCGVQDALWFRDALIAFFAG